MKKNEVNDLIVSLYQKLIREREEEKNNFFDYISDVSDDKDTVEKLATAYAFACFFYEDLEAGKLDSSKFNKKERELISLFYQSEDMNFYEDEQEEEQEFIDSFRSLRDDDSDDDDDSSEIN